MTYRFHDFISKEELAQKVLFRWVSLCILEAVNVFALVCSVTCKYVHACIIHVVKTRQGILIKNYKRLLQWMYYREILKELS